MRAATAPVWAALLTILGALAPACGAEKAEVYDCLQLRQALANASVGHIVAMRAGRFNCSAAQLPEDRPVEIEGREVLLEGEGPGMVYVDHNRVWGVHAVLHGGANLTVANLWLDDCLANDTGVLCIASVAADGFLHVRDARLSDAACARARASAAIQEVEGRIRFTREFLQGQARAARHARDVDARTVLIAESGRLQGVMHGSAVRFTNLTLSCTGNVTHPLPEGFVDDAPLELPAAVWLGIGAGLLALAGGMWWCAVSRGRNVLPPAYRIAESRGFVLEVLLGKGHFGRVYRGRQKSTGQPVAVKVLDLLPSQRRQLAAACRECQLLASVRHDSVVRVITFHTARVHRRRQRMEVDSASGADEYVGLEGEATSGGSGTLPRGSADTSEAADLQQPLLPRQLPSEKQLKGLPSSAAKPGGPPRAPAAAAGPPWRSPAGEAQEAMSIQVQLVTQYCDMGTLDQAVKRGLFADAATGQPKLRHILLTALDIAQGLEYLHHPDRCMVHRDLSATNVLLTTAAADNRGFRALLSDFGLTTALSPDQTHKTSQIKGTVAYMSPEVFIHDSVSPALDIYSLGVLLHLMYSGQEPYAGHSQAMLILAKVQAGAKLPALQSCPGHFQQLVWDCTHADRRSRPTAATVALRLDALLLSL